MWNFSKTALALLVATGVTLGIALVASQEDLTGCESVDSDGVALTGDNDTAPDGPAVDEEEC